jgi:hypothetical protein
MEVADRRSWQTSKTTQFLKVLVTMGPRCNQGAANAEGVHLFVKFSPVVAPAVSHSGADLGLDRCTNKLSIMLGYRLQPAARGAEKFSSVASRMDSLLLLLSNRAIVDFRHRRAL